MSLLKSIADGFEEAKQYEELIAKQYRYRMMMQRYWKQYWFIALVLAEAIKAKKSLLKVEEPNIPKLLMPHKYNPKNLNDFGFVLGRSPQNTTFSDIAVLPHEIERTLTDYFITCGFANFKFLCNEDNYKYYIRVRAFDKFCFGYPLASGIGEILYNSKLYNDYTNAYGMFDIEFYNGGTCGGLKEGKQFLLYYDGIWSKAGVA